MGIGTEILGGLGEDAPKERPTDGATGAGTSTFWGTFSATSTAIDQAPMVAEHRADAHYARAARGQPVKEAIST